MLRLSPERKVQQEVSKEDPKTTRPTSQQPDKSFARSFWHERRMSKAAESQEKVQKADSFVDITSLLIYHLIKSNRLYIKMKT